MLLLLFIILYGILIMKMKVIFLDIDGVLNKHNWSQNKTPWMEDSKVELIGRLCKDTGAKVVLASNWRETWLEPMFYENETTAIYRGHKLFKKNNIEVVGITGRGENRSEEIKQYLKDNPNITNYVSIDDTIVDVDNRVQTNGDIGLTQFDCQKASQLLK